MGSTLGMQHGSNFDNNIVFTFPNPINCFIMTIKYSNANIKTANGRAPYLWKLHQNFQPPPMLWQ